MVLAWGSTRKYGMYQLKILYRKGMIIIKHDKDGSQA